MVRGPNWMNIAAQARGGSGVISIKTSDRNGQVVGAIQVTDEDEMMLNLR